MFGNLFPQFSQNTQQAPAEKSPLFETLLQKASAIGPEPIPEVTQAGVPPPGGGAFTKGMGMWRMLRRPGLPAEMSSGQKYLPLKPAPDIVSATANRLKELLGKFGGRGGM
jgi:hypothetical protein